MKVAVKRGDRSTYVLPPVRPARVGGDSGPTSGSVYIGSVGSPALARARANGQAAFAVYQRDPDRAWNAHAVLVPTVTTTGISRIIGFVNPDLFTLFGLPQEIPGRPAAIPGDRAGL